MIWQQCAYLIITANLTNSLFILLSLILISNHLFSYSLRRYFFNIASFSKGKQLLGSFLSKISQFLSSYGLKINCVRNPKFSQNLFKFFHMVSSLNYKVGTLRKHFRPAETWQWNLQQRCTELVKLWGWRNKNLHWNDSRLAESLKSRELWIQ